MALKKMAPFIDLSRLLQKRVEKMHSLCRCFLAICLLTSIISSAIIETAQASVFNGTGFSSDDRVSSIGEVSTSRYVGGALISTVPAFWYIGAYAHELNRLDISGVLLPGLGVGELIQGRYSETGWIVTSGEVMSLYLMDNEYHHGGQDIGVIYAAGYLAFRFYEVYDVWFGAVQHNKKVSRLSLTLSPTGHSGMQGIVSVAF